jgi:hypothetical protein
LIERSEAKIRSVEKHSAISAGQHSLLLLAEKGIEKSTLQTSVRQLELSELLVLPVVLLVFIYLVHFKRPLLII